MQTITRAELLGAHPSVQDLNIINNSTTNNPVKAARMAALRQNNSAFIGDEPQGLFAKHHAKLCAPAGGQRVVVHRHEENIRKGRTPPSVVGAAVSAASLKAQLPPMLSKDASVSSPGGQNNNNNNSSNNNLPPKSPAGASRSGKPNEPLAALQLKALSMPQLIRQAAKRRRPGATPSDLSLVTSVESRDASTNHPASETVYTCSCCRPNKPSSDAGRAGGATNNALWKASEDGDGSEFYESDLYENLTSVSQRGSARGGATGSSKKKPAAEVQQISAQQIYELQQARAGGAGSLGHNVIGSGARGPKPMGFGLTGQKLMQDGKIIDAMQRAAAGCLLANEKLPPGMARSVVTSLTGTTTGAASSAKRSSASRSSRASSSAVRRLEVALEQERHDRLQTEEQISRIRERQEKLLAQLTPDEKTKMRQLLEKQQ